MKSRVDGERICIFESAFSLFLLFIECRGKKYLFHRAQFLRIGRFDNWKICNKDDSSRFIEYKIFRIGKFVIKIILNTFFCRVQLFRVDYFDFEDNWKILSGR